MQSNSTYAKKYETTNLISKFFFSNDLHISKIVDDPSLKEASILYPVSIFPILTKLFMTVDIHEGIFTYKS